MSNLPATVRLCIDEAVARSARMAERAVDHAVESLEKELRRRESSSERLDIGGAIHQLMLHRNAWRSRLPQALRSEMESPPRPAGGVRMHPSSLTLVDDSAISESIESSRLAQELAVLVERPLAEFDALMSSALGLDGVHPDENPLRPAVVTRALRTVMGESQPQPGWPALWMRPMAEPLALELKELYRACSELLSQARVKAASYRVITAPGALGPRASQPAPLEQGGSAPMPLERGGGQRPRGLSGFAELAVQALRGPGLREFLFGQAAPSQHHRPAPSYYAAVDQELAQLQERWDDAPYDAQEARRHETLPPVERPARAVGTASPLDGQVWGEMGAPRQRALVRTRLKKQAREVGQAMGLEVVRQLVDQVARDERLLAPVREAIVALEPSLARLALQDPRFFGQAENPARRLVEGVAVRSFKYNDEFSGEFQSFFGEVSEQFNALNRLEAIADAQPFEQALQRLKAGWEAHDAADQERRDKVMAAVRFAEQRQAEAEQIAWKLSQRSDLEGVPAVVQDFLFGPWSLVMAHAKLTDSRREMDPGGFVGVISDLLWSVKREQTVREPARAFERIPRVLVKLRAGLDLIGHPPADSETFFQALERLHRPVLKLRAKHRQQAYESSPMPLAADDELLRPAAHHTPEPPEELWLAPEDLQACGFEDTLPSDFAALTEDAAPQPAASAPVQPLSEAQAQATIAGLREGAWVDLYSRQQWRRAQLVWAGTRGTLFMFVSHGGRPHSMTRRSLQRLVADRLLRPVQGHEVVQHAIDAIAHPSAPAPTEAVAA